MSNGSEDGALNVAANCLDRHLESGGVPDHAIIWEGDNPSESRAHYIPAVARRGLPALPTLA